MSLRTIAIILILAGLVIGAVSVLADVIGIGSGDSINGDDFGTRQIIGLIVGVVVLAVGVVIYLRERRSEVPT
ncbi:MAG: hypothetical protein D6737_08700 [Chloroflexi bacterium]|nr:MAG: hypothetical protein D6737_08700 [Chloroflexota bacterium]